MKKMNKIFNLAFAVVFFTFIFANHSFAQDANEGLATGQEENTLKADESIEANNKVAMIEKNEAIQPIVEKTTSRTVAVQKSKTQKIVEKFTKSKVVQWLAKRTAIHAEKKAMRQELGQVKGDKTAQKAIKQKYEDRIKNVKALDNNLRIGIILVLVGIILTILLNDILALGTIVILVGLVFIILGLI